MNNFYKILLTCFLIFGNVLTNAQIAPPPPGGGQTPETLAAPIDMYIYLLAIVAVFLMFKFSKKIQQAMN